MPQRNEEEHLCVRVDFALINWTFVSDIRFCWTWLYVIMTELKGIALFSLSIIVEC